MNVSPSQPFQLVYSLLQHEYLGYLFEASAVQLNARGELSLQYQTVASRNVGEFAAGLDEADFQLVKLIDAIQQDAIAKKFNTKRSSPIDFFLKIYDPQKGDKAIQEAIAGYVEAHKCQIMPLLLGKRLFVAGNDGVPTAQAVDVLPEPATVRFHFTRNPDNTHYYPSIRYAGQKVDFQQREALFREASHRDVSQRDAFILCDQPAWLFLDNKLYHFEPGVDGKKLRPFLTKKFIVIPKNIEEDYYRKFVSSIITQFDVYAKGFEIRQEAYAPVPLLNLSEAKTDASTTNRSKLYATEETPVVEEDSHQEGRVTFNLGFQYGEHAFRFDSFAAAANVSMEKNGDEYIFHKVSRDLRGERETVSMLKNIGLDVKNGRATLGKTGAFDWLQTHRETLNQAGFVIGQNPADSKRYFLGYSSIAVSIREGNDWFDVYATVRFGEFEIPFLKLRSLILARKREFTLPNGEIAVIPEAWLTQYSDLLALSEPEGPERLSLRKHHLALVQDLQREQLATATMSRKLEKLRDFEEIESYPIPEGLRGTLRPYQKAGYDWLRFLNQYRFGGCLADDMGLGKTIETLALIQSQYDEEPSAAPALKLPGISFFNPSSKGATLVVMPTSLIYNWQQEAEKFTPGLNILVYTGTYRDKDLAQFDQYDVVLTSYGIVRIDIDLLKRYQFHYVILDESQAIKNPSSHVTRAVLQLQARHRLILTGTPLENSTLDLWSQMSFINPGLLGNQTFFRNEFQIPIEKKGDDQKTRRLYGLIKPFMLRRHKSQVATELPPKVESLHYCAMTEEQERAYEEAKSYYRNMILEHIDQEGMARSQMVVLQGLTRLRQLANHPRLADPGYEDGSGKREDVLHKIETALSENHKILIFSQFVKHLDLFREHLDRQHISYAYLDGNTHDRQAQVALFQENDSVKLFLISLKAGGLGLNLTAADYVFILDPWWNPAVEAQAVDRAHRIGQDKTVFTYKFITKGTVEEKILALQRNKQRLASELVTTEEGFVKSLTKEDVLALLE